MPKAGRSETLQNIYNFKYRQTLLEHEMSITFVFVCFCPLGLIVNNCSRITFYYGKERGDEKLTPDAATVGNDSNCIVGSLALPTFYLHGCKHPRPILSKLHICSPSSLLLFSWWIWKKYIYMYIHNYNSRIIIYLRLTTSGRAYETEKLRDLHHATNARHYKYWFLQVSLLLP